MPQAPPAGEVGPFRLRDVGLGVLAAAGASSERDASLRELQGGHHDPRRRGFTFQQAELALAGEVDGVCDVAAALVAGIDAESGETEIELEEAFATSTGLPFGLEVKAGTFLTEFGRTNPTHPHDQDWLDQPVLATRLFGGDGMRGPGARLAWRPAGGFGLGYSLQNADGETMPSFVASREVRDERAVGGRSFGDEPRDGGDLVHAVRADAAFGPDDIDVALGASAAFGPNGSGRAAHTVLLGADLRLHWHGGAHGGGFRPWWTAEAEWAWRAFDAAEQRDAGDPSTAADDLVLPRTMLRDQGAYAQVLHGFAACWSAGVRVEGAWGAGASYDAGARTFGRADDPLRCDRVRIAPLLTMQPSPATRLRLQYDWDDSDHLSGPAHSVWLGFEVRLGGHGSPAHAGHRH